MNPDTQDMQNTQDMTHKTQVMTHELELIRRMVLNELNNFHISPEECEKINENLSKNCNKSDKTNMNEVSLYLRICFCPNHLEINTKYPPCYSDVIKNINDNNIIVGYCDDSPCTPITNDEEFRAFIQRCDGDCVFYEV